MNIKEKFKQLESWKKVVVILSVILIAIIILLLLNNWYVKNQLDKGNLVEWNGKIYTKEEINKLYPPQYVEVAAKNTPEEVYSTFRQALLDNNIDLALEQISNESKDKYRGIFNDVNKLEKYKNIPIVSDIKKSEKDSYGNFSNYYYFMKDSKDKIPYQIEFIKDVNGYWKIKFI